MAAKKTRKKTETKTVTPPVAKAAKKVTSNEKIIKNGTVMNRGDLGSQKFLKGTKVWLLNETYSGNFKVTEEQRDSGTDYRRIEGGGSDVVVSLHYLQAEYARGALQLLDEKGNPIVHKTLSI